MLIAMRNIPRSVQRQPLKRGAYIPENKSLSRQASQSAIVTSSAFTAENSGQDFMMQLSVSIRYRLLRGFRSGCAVINFLYLSITSLIWAVGVGWAGGARIAAMTFAWRRRAVVLDLVDKLQVISLLS